MRTGTQIPLRFLGIDSLTVTIGACLIVNTHDRTHASVSKKTEYDHAWVPSASKSVLKCVKAKLSEKSKASVALEEDIYHRVGRDNNRRRRRGFSGCLVYPTARLNNLRAK